MYKILQSITLVISLLAASNSSANIITEVLSGSDNGFGYSGLHHATRNGSMSGANFSNISLSTAHTSFYHEGDFSNGDNFVLYVTLDSFSDSLLTLSGSLDFDSTGLLIGSLYADFANNTLVGVDDTTFKFANGVMNIAGVNVPKPNSIDGDLLSLWGANSTADPLSGGGIGFEPTTATLGLDLVVRWEDVPEPAPLALMGFGLFLVTIRKRHNTKT